MHFNRRLLKKSVPQGLNDMFYIGEISGNGVDNECVCVVSSNK